MCRLAQDDFLMAREREDGRVYFVGGLVAMPGFYLMSEKLGMSLAEAHDPVPYVCHHSLSLAPVTDHHHVVQREAAQVRRASPHPLPSRRALRADVVGGRRRPKPVPACDCRPWSGRSRRSADRAGRPMAAVRHADASQAAAVARDRVRCAPGDGATVGLCGRSARARAAGAGASRRGPCADASTLLSFPSPD
jgi:hypothetical protein